MFATIRKHQKWLFALISVVVIISFVVYFGPSAGQGLSGGPSEVGRINGRPITAAQVKQARLEAQLFFFLNYGRFPDAATARQVGFDPEAETRQRIIIADLADRLNIRVGNEAIMKQVRNMRQFQNENGVYDPDAFRLFRENVLAGVGMDQDAFFEFLRHQLQAMHLGDLVTVPGALVTESAARELYTRQNESLLTSAVFFHTTNFLASVEVTDEALKTFFEQRKAIYMEPEKVQVRYVTFHATNFLGQAEEMAAADPFFTNRVEETYQSRGTNSFKGPEGKPLEAAAALIQVREDLLRQIALGVAETNANRFVNEVARMEPVQTPNLDKVAQKWKLSVQVSKPFSRAGETDEFQRSFQVAQKAFELDAEMPFAPQIPGTNQVYVLALDKLIPRAEPAFDKVRKQVVEDFQRQKAREAMEQAGQKFYQVLTNGVAEGKTFEALAQENKRELVEVSGISQASQFVPEIMGRVNPGDYQRAAFNAKVGEISPFKSSGEGGFILKVKARQPVSEEQLQAELPDFTKRLRNQESSRVFREWFGRQQGGLSGPIAGS